MKRIHLLPNVFTAFGLACALFVIFKINLLEDDVNHFEMVRSSAILLLVAAAADVLDGAVARLTNAESHFGAIFDSISDAVSFGVAPAIIALKAFPWQDYEDLSLLVTAAAMIFTICGVLRLVRYSVWGLHPSGDAPDQKKSFIGLPIPAAASGVVSSVLFLLSEESRQWLVLSTEESMLVIAGIMVLLGYFMISKWKFPSLKALRFRIRSFNLVLLTVVGAALILYGIHKHFSTAYFTVVWFYIFIAWMLSVIRLVVGKRLKTLDDFEPAKEDLVQEAMSSDIDDL